MIKADRVLFIKGLKEIVKTRPAIAPHANALVVKADCGCVVKYKKIKDITIKNVRCKHGKWLIKWE